MSITAMKQALEALEWNLPVIEDYGDKEQLNRQHKAITSLYDALRQAIEQAEKQEPVAYQNTQEKCRIETVPAQGGLLPTMQEGKDFTITHPQPQREWVGLTDDEIDLLEELYAPPVHPDFVNDASHCLELIRHIEAKLKEKNT